MNVVYIINTDFAVEGTGIVAYHAVNEIYKSNYLKKLICRDYKKTDISENKIIKPVPFGRFFPMILNGVSMYLLPNLPTQIINDTIFDLLSLRYIDKCDIFHSWNHPVKCLLKAKKLGAKTIIEGASAHYNVTNKIYLEEYKKFGIKYKPMDRWTLKKIDNEIKNCDYIFVPSEFAEKSYIEQGINKNKLIKIPFGVDIKKFKPKQKKDSIFRAIYVGRISLEKGIQYLLEAWSSLELKNAELLLCGRVMPNIRKIVDKYKNNKTIKLLGHVNPIKYYQNSDIFIFPSLQEGSALVTYEAMACGLPLITTSNSGSVAREGKDGFIIPIRNIKQLKEKIKYFYDNPNEIKRMGKNARKRAEKYTWEKYGERVVKEYEKMVE